MKRLVPVLFLVCVLSCNNRDYSKIVLPYNWPDSLIAYTVYPDSVEFRFLRPTKVDSFHVVQLLLEDRKTKHMISPAPQQDYKITNGKMVVPFKFDTVFNPADISVRLYGLPDDGFQLTTFKGYYVAAGTQVYFPIDSASDTLSLRLYRIEPQGKMYFIPYKLVYGDSAFYYAKNFKDFMRDSFRDIWSGNVRDMRKQY